MKRIVVATALSLLIGLPAGAQDLNSLSVERDQLFQLIMSGKETDKDVARFKELTAQINQAMNNRFKESNDRLNELNQKVQVMEQHRREVIDALSGGLQESIQGSGGGNSKSIHPINSHISDAANSSSQPDLPSTGYPAPVLPISGELRGQVTNDVITPAFKALLEKDPDFQEASAGVAKYSTKMQQLIAGGKDYINYLFPFRGFSPSSEGGNIVLGEQLKVKGLPAALLLQQLAMDKAHLTFIVDLLQFGLDGKTPPEGIDPAAFQGPMGDNPSKFWDMKTINEKQKTLLLAAIDEDPTLQGIVSDLHKYNHRSKTAMTASKIIEPALAAGSMVPMFIGPICRGALANYIFATGGAEENKLLKEIYLDKRMESRVQTLSSEIDLAVTAYQLSAYTGNTSLQASAEAVLESLIPKDKLAEILR